MTPFKLYILGCGSALPTPRHYASSQIVELRGKQFMVDCGEGTQIQLRRSRIGFNKIRAVFISHLHGDHCFGLIGMISTFGLQGRTAPLHVYSPKELEEMLMSQLKFFCTHLSFDVVFHAVDTSGQSVVYEDNSLTVETIPLEHRVPCCGYLFREKPTLPHIRRDMIDYLGIPVSQINNIKLGADWVCEDGTVVSNSRLVSPPDSVRSYAYCSDTRYMPTLYERLKNVDLLYHESTYGDDNMQMAETYYHSTARQAACVARDAGVKRLLLGHYSSRYDNEEVLLKQAQEVFPDTYLANEKMVIEV
ncbi:ribonuclease Z [Prevotella koreensis]|uniref:Ribonuclease Z n=1 Tax=Prevotella koreensis TaxID=2490854 RepID=A0A432LJF8_9BACT|nr:ribonuclease Z [Prevotella koreensis]RUL58768.1 ribonuclease Z [Prevotella koreensis]